MNASLDPRLHAWRSDLADERLSDRVQSECFVKGEDARVTFHFADVFARPDTGSGLQAQFLHGHDVHVFERRDDWAWVQRATDGYVGYTREEWLSPITELPTHMVLAPRTFLYPGPDLKFHRSGYRSIGSRVTVVDETETRGTRYARLASGHSVIANHLIRLGDWRDDPVAVAETLLHTPYLWGGDSGFGVDCSGLVALGHLLCGRTVPRDSDMQAASLGEELPLEQEGLRRGDLVFWKGHVGMMSDGKTLLHANGHTMNVAHEPLADAIERIGYLYGQPTAMRRP